MNAKAQRLQRVQHSKQDGLAPQQMGKLVDKTRQKPIRVLADFGFGVIELNEEDDCDCLQILITLLGFGFDGDGVAKFREQLSDDAGDTLVDLRFVDLQSEHE